MGSENLHEREDLLSPGTKDLHRAIVSLMEELEAIDWYGQRAEACTDPELRAVILHNREEEIEHAMMTLEWIRRRHADFAGHIGTYLNSEGPITAVEESVTGASGAAGTIEGNGGGSARARGGATADGSLGIGSLRVGGG